VNITKGAMFEQEGIVFTHRGCSYPQCLTDGIRYQSFFDI